MIKIFEKRGVKLIKLRDEYVGFITALTEPRTFRHLFRDGFITALLGQELFSIFSVVVKIKYTHTFYSFIYLFIFFFDNVTSVIIHSQCQSTPLQESNLISARVQSVSLHKILIC